MPDGLPAPDSSELDALLVGRGWSWSERAIYRHLFEYRDGDGLTISDLWSLVQPEREQRLALGKKAGEARHFDRRLRKLDDLFDVRRSGGGEQTRYQLVGVLANPKVPETRINKVDRAWVLRHQRCAQCGRTPNDDGVRLHVDHKIPRDWGGTNDRENLQALCSECNEGKKAYYATFDVVGPEIREAFGHDSVYVRIGELLKAFDAEGLPAPADVLEFVAEARGPQRYWEKRMRELRHLGWEFEPRMYDEDGIRKTEWSLIRWEPWPEEGPGAAIRRVTRDGL